MILVEPCVISDALKYHLLHKIPLSESVYRVGSSAWLKLVNECRELFNCGVLHLYPEDKFIVETEAGKFGMYEGDLVPLDCPFIYDDNLYGVFVMDNGSVKKILFPKYQSVTIKIDNRIVEDLEKWFEREKWVRINSKGEIAGKCGTSKNKNNPDRCLPQKKAKSLSKQELIATYRKKKEFGKNKQFVKNTEKAETHLKR